MTRDNVRFVSNHQTTANPEDNQEQLNPNLGTENLETNSTHSFSRRSFLGRAGASTLVAAAASAGLPALLSEKAEGQIAESDSRADQSFQLRFNAAVNERNVPIPAQNNNGDEARYPNYIGNYSQGLPHDSIGEVEPAAYQALLTAVSSGKPSDFANIPLGGTVKLSDPQGGLAFDLEGTDSGQLTIPPSPALASAERAGEMVEVILQQSNRLVSIPYGVRYGQGTTPPHFLRIGPFIVRRGGQGMKKTVLWLLVVVAAGCSGTKSSSGPPFLEGLAVSKEAPIEPKCRGDISGGFQFSDKDQFRAAYEGMKDAQANGKVYAPGNGPAYDFRYFQSCEVTQSGRSFESWARR